MIPIFSFWVEKKQRFFRSIGGYALCGNCADVIVRCCMSFTCSFVFVRCHVSFACSRINSPFVYLIFCSL
jgi:hypothetical protein